MKRPANPADLRGYGRLAVDATLGLVDLVEAMHHNITRLPGTGASGEPERTRGVTGLVYGAVRGVTRLVGLGVDIVLGQVADLLGQGTSSPEREALLAALNGVLGDHLAATGNPLAISMQWRHGGVPLPPEREALAAVRPPLGGRLLVLVHGLCMNDLMWQRHGHDHGAALAAALGYTPLYLHYNTGCHISDNGRALAELLERTVQAWPVPVTSIAIVGHSMGGLVARSACHYGQAAGHGWRQLLRKMVFLGTPHQGAPLEQGGNWLEAILGTNRYTRAFSRLGKIRSAGITDLRHGSLVDEDWVDQDRFSHRLPQPRVVPLPADVQCYAAGVVLGTSGELRGKLLGDGLVPLRSALGQHRGSARCLAFPPEHQWTGYSLNHLDLLDNAGVYRQLQCWLADPPATG